MDITVAVHRYAAASGTTFWSWQTTCAKKNFTFSMKKLRFSFPVKWLSKTYLPLT